MTIAKSTVANVAAEEGTSQQETHMGTSQHGVDLNAQPEVLDHLRERMSETDEFLPHHGDGAAGCTKGRWTVSDWKKSESTQDSWVVSAGKWFADEKEDTGLQTAEDSKFFGIASSIESFSNEGKELIIQQPETSYASHTGLFGQIVGMLEQMLSHIQSDL